MLLQSTLSSSMPNPLSSNIPHPLSSPFGCHLFTPLSIFRTLNHSVKCSSVSQVYKSYGDENNQMWTRIYGRFHFRDPQLEVASVLNQLEKEGKELTKSDLCRVAIELKKFKQFRLALEVYEWMNNRIERFELSSGDIAIQLGLINKLCGISSAEDYFMRIPDARKDYKIYGALLRSYVGSKERDKAESLMDQLRNKGYTKRAHPFNAMMMLYSKLNEYDKIDQLISEMKQKNVQPDMRSYIFLLSAQESKGSAEGMEHILEQMKLDRTIYPKWMKFRVMASFYMKLGQIEKAEDCLRNLEAIIRGQDDMPYRHLIVLYSVLGKKEEVYRVWSLYQSKFPKVRNMGYRTLISACIRLGDIEGAEKFCQEWLQGTSRCDAEIGNVLLSWYAREEPFEKAKHFFDRMTEAGRKPNSSSWGLLAYAYTKAGRISGALSCYRKAFSLIKGEKTGKRKLHGIDDFLIKGEKTGKRKLHGIDAFLDLCDREGDTASKDEFVAMLGNANVAMTAPQKEVDGDAEETEGEDSEMLMAIME